MISALQRIDGTEADGEGKPNASIAPSKTTFIFRELFILSFDNNSKLREILAISYN